MAARGRSGAGVWDPDRELGLDGVDPELSRKLDGGPRPTDKPPRAARPGVRSALVDAEV